MSALTDTFYFQAEKFVEDILNLLQKNQVTIPNHWDMDHICYRVDTLEKYTLIKNEFQSLGKLLIETDVNGRPIATYKLHKPIVYKNIQISVIELPAPKKGKITPEGFEHVEIVCNVPFSSLQKRFSHLQLDEGGLKKPFNQELEIVFGDKNVKFHHLSLESVVRLEGNKKVYSAIQQSKILEILKSYEALVAGTFPLGIHNAESDVDILVYYADDLKSLLQKEYSHFKDFNLQEYDVDGVPSLVCQFHFNEVPFEIFAQKIQPIKQRGYQHFLIEEKLLRMGGDNFLKAVLENRKQGLKTEPAFYKALQLSGDAYVGLLNTEMILKQFQSLKF